ncbi:hypothetical protein SNEBB_004221 [Seison nebaliae]|nr:hypothetical protein SNEBB_004221 [Seison nebaliae]
MGKIFSRNKDELPDTGNPNFPNSYNINHPSYQPTNGPTNMQQFPTKPYEQERPEEIVFAGEVDLLNDPDGYNVLKKWKEDTYCHMKHPVAQWQKDMVERHNHYRTKYGSNPDDYDDHPRKYHRRKCRKRRLPPTRSYSTRELPISNCCCCTNQSTSFNYPQYDYSFLRRDLMDQALLKLAANDNWFHHVPVYEGCGTGIPINHNDNWRYNSVINAPNHHRIRSYSHSSSPSIRIKAKKNSYHDNSSRPTVRTTIIDPETIEDRANDIHIHINDEMNRKVTKVHASDTSSSESPASY